MVDCNELRCNSRSLRYFNHSVISASYCFLHVPNSVAETAQPWHWHRYKMSGASIYCLKRNPKFQARRCSDPPVPTQEVDPDDADDDKDIDPDTAVPSSNDKEDP